MSDELNAMAFASSLAATILSKVGPAGATVALTPGQLSAAATMAKLLDDIHSRNTADTEIYVPGIGTIPASSAAIELAAKFAGVAAIAGSVAGAATAGPAALAAGAAAVAAALANPSVRNILSDPTFWETVNRGRLDPSQLPNLLNDYFRASQRWINPRRDPLTLDLDGDGIETVPFSAAAPILFDHDGDGIKTGTGWIKADDGFLVLDRNGNGAIDNGTELFGDSTPLAGGGTAADGFAALAQEDTNQDGRVDNLDARWTQLRVWQDANQDGISQAAELKTLADLGIAAINVGKTEHSRLLADGNEIADLGSFVRSDGSLGGTGVVSALADVNLGSDTFHRSYTDAIPLTAEAEALPEIEGSGRVRDLKEAASLSPALAAAGQAINAGMSVASMRAQVDVVLDQWAQTSDLASGVEQAAANGMKLFYVVPGTTWGELEAYRDLLGGTPTGWTGATRTVADLTEAERQKYETLLAQQASLDRLIGTLERFNGTTYVQVGANKESWRIAA